MQTASERQMNSGLLVIRLGLAASLLAFAIPRLIDGAGAWQVVGREMPFSLANVSNQVVGLIILAIAVLGALGLLTGYLFRISATLLTVVYGLYFFNFINVGYKTLPLYAGALACVCIGLIVSGPGRFAVAVKIETK